MKTALHTIPIFQYPTTTVWLDDDDLFLDTVQLHFEKHQGNHKFFANPEHCLAFLKGSLNKKPQSQKNFIYGDHKNEQYSSIKHLPINFDITKIAEVSRYPKMPQEVSVLVIDHNMPITKGLDICYKLKGLPFKKILLTGAAQNQDVISAFNNGIINHFFRKDEPGLFKNITLVINVLTRQYFCEQTAHLLSYLEIEHSLPLSNERFALFFEEIITKIKIKEFYLIDKNGSFLLIDAQDKKYFLIIHTDHSLDEFCRFHSDICEIKELISAIVQRDKIPFFGLGKELAQISSENWNTYFHKPNVLEAGKEKYYWVLINDNNNV